MMNKPENAHAPQLSPQPLAKMMSAYIASPGTVGFKTVPVPIPNDNQVLIRLEGCGLCGSDLPVWEGRPWFNYPYPAGTPGHEGFGTVERIGEQVKTVAPGDRVAMLSYHAYAEYDIAEADQVIKLPRQFDGLPFPGEPLGCSINIFNRCKISSTDIVAIVGAGFIGNLLVQLCRSAGAKVIAISRRESSLQTAFESGADHVVRMDDLYQLLKRVNEITQNDGCSCVIEATGKQTPLDIAGEIAAVRGRLVIAGFHQEGLRQVNVQNWNWKGLDVINAHERDPQEYVKGMRMSVDSVLSGVLNPGSLFTHQYKFDSLNTAFKDMSQGLNGYIKGIVRMY